MKKDQSAGHAKIQHDLVLGEMECEQERGRGW